jgi:putative FmdB family regulatory protein
MPIFDFECNSCQHIWEDFVSTSAKMPDECPNCNSKEMRKLISCPSLGVVELTGHDLKAKIKSDAKKMKQELKTNENKFINFIGENKAKTFIK